MDGVIICSPSDTHHEIILGAAKAGKHIFCEKPIDYNLKRIDEALATVAQSGVKFQLGFQRRFDANFQRVRQAVQGGKLECLEGMWLHVMESVGEEELTKLIVF